jgi:hypothetical protein
MPMKGQKEGIGMLEGTLETFSLASVVRLIDDSAATGRLSVQGTLGTGSLVFDGGRLVDALPAPGGDAIEGALALFDHRQGRFSFRPEAVGERSINLDVRGLLELVEERREAWVRIRELVPSDTPLAVLPERRIDGMVTVSAHAWRVAVLANGRTAAGLASACGMTEFSVCNILVELLEQGLIVSLAHQPSHEAGQARMQRAQPVAEDDDEMRQRVDDVEPERLDAVDSGADDLDPSDLLRELGGDAEQPRPARKRR